MSTKITYNGKTTELADGYIATLPCKDYKMETDVVVEAPEESGGSSINVQPLTATENGTWDAPEGQAYDPVTVNVKPITEPITITENGVYPVPKGGSLVEGETYTFKNEGLENIDFSKYMKTPLEGREGVYTLFVTETATLVYGTEGGAFGLNVLVYETMEGDSVGAYMYTLEEGGAWLDAMVNEPATTSPSMTIPSPYDAASVGGYSLEELAVFFDVETKSLDGWGDITVNVAPLPIEVSTEAEMTALLTSGEVGGVYKYVGETTDAYENGALYVLEEEENSFMFELTGVSTYSNKYNFDSGMTWQDFIASDYNTTGPYNTGPSSAQGKSFYGDSISAQNTPVFFAGPSGGTNVYLNGVEVKEFDLVQSGVTYTSAVFTAGGGN